MATISKFGIPEIGKGIHYPLLANRFRVLFSSGSFGESDHYELTAQTVRIKTDFKNKELRFSIEQPATGEVLELIEDLVSHPSRVVVQAMDGCDGVLSAIEYTQLKTVSHDFTLDYAAPSHCATHEVVMKFSHMLIKSIVPGK